MNKVYVMLGTSRIFLVHICNIIPSHPNLVKSCGRPSRCRFYSTGPLTGEPVSIARSYRRYSQNDFVTLLLDAFLCSEERRGPCLCCVWYYHHNQTILIEWADLAEVRKKYFEVRFLYSLFRNVIPEAIFDFLREIGVFYKKHEVWWSNVCVRRFDRELL